MTTPTDNSPALQVTELEKRFGGVRALGGAGLRAAEGTVHALLGENGAGKSTLSKVLSGVVSADSGKVSLHGHELTLGSPVRARAAGIRTAFQELSFVPDLTVAENLTFERPPRNFAGHLLKRKARARATEMLEEVGLLDLLKIDVAAPVRTLDLAQRQLLEVARACNGSPRVLILDEATSALPADESAWVLKRARDAATAGAIVIFISHRMNEVREVADDLTVMRAGQTVASGAVDDFDDDQIIEAMLGRKIGRLYPTREHSRGELLIKVEELTAKPRLGPLDLDVYAGEILGIGGLEGHGQKQVLQALGSAIPYSGRLVLDGKQLKLRSPADALSHGIVLVPEDRQREGLLLTKSIRHNVSLSSLRVLRSRIGTIDRRRELEQVREGAQRVNIDLNRLDDPVSVLSGGNQQKVILARALMAKPRVVLLYDCTRGVDVGTKSEIHQLVADLAAEGVAVVVYASDLEEMVKLCDRVVVLREGRIAGELTASIDTSSILRLAVDARSAEAVA